ncbi:polyhydroxyalkanoate synthesis repressor PhaR [Aestuariivirga litoralis]|uniref:polyhydroxyalkanoate synthesis repressor PhaR n=1 Tax=Aestuariivirga litoralis TaxID=2650924 RepID=UPI0018C71EB9
MSEDQSQGTGAKQATVIKKYANRRLYNTATSTYVTLDDLSQMVKNSQDFLVYDAKTGEDITHSVLTQIIFEEENKGSQNLLPVNFLRQLIKFYGDQMQGVVPGYLDFSLDNLVKDQDKIRKQMLDQMGMGGIAEPFKGMEDQAKRNMAMFNEAVKMFNPFANVMGGAPNPVPPKPEAAPAASSDDLATLKEQMAAMQRKLDTISK